MTINKITISGTGCALADFLYNNISFDNPGFKNYMSLQEGDGGLSPGKLVFTEELERFSGDNYSKILTTISGNSTPDAFNVGGPSLVSMVHAAQILDNKKFEVKFFGMAGKDDISGKIFKILRNTPLNIDHYHTTGNYASPFTDVFSDPSYDGGHGERTFVNNIGAAWEYFPQNLPDEFFDSKIVCFGGTALVPHIHDNLTSILSKAKNNNCITLVNTVFDFRNEKNTPGKPWLLGNSTESFGFIDILIMDHIEALKISGQKSIEEAAAFFSSSGVTSFIITNGVNPVYGWSGGRLFKKAGIIQLPVSKKVTDDLKSKPELKGDTTGCGDNFAGGIIASLAWQLQKKAKGQFDLVEAISWGIASGGHSCFIIGGTFLEKFKGEKLRQVSELQKEYIYQIGNSD
jgi:sugar/nucleoside kinase (ribokinase family)